MKMLSALGSLLAVMLMVAPASAQLTAPGDLMFVGFNADGNDGFAVIALRSIANGTTVYFTDNEWDGTVFNATEGTVTWNNNTGGALAAGTVIVLTNTQAAPAATYGTASLTGSANLGASNEAVYAYLGTAIGAPTVFLSAIANSTMAGAGASITNTGMTVGAQVIEMGNNDDVAVYDGTNSCDGLTVSQCAAQIANFATSWSSEGGSGDQDADMSYPDYPADITSDFSTTPVELVGFEVE